MTQQQWGAQPPWGQVGGQTQRGLGQVLFGQGQATRGRGFGGPQFGQPFGPGQFAPPPRRRKSGLRGFVFALMLLAIIGFVAMAGTNTATSTAEAPYENEDYQVPPPDRSPPPLPLPETYEEAEQLVVSNPLYRQTTPPVDCDAQPINVETARDAQLKSHFESLMECLVRVWQPPVEKAGFVIVRPTVTVYGREVTTKCGKTDVNAFYCSADQQVYFSNLLPEYVTIVKTNKWAADVVMAHEFGHALQGRTGILISSNALGQNSGSKSTELELSRRLETQADCFSALYTNAVAQSLGIQQSDVAGIEATYAAVGDDVVSRNPNIVGNHGLAKSRRYWGSVGLRTTDIGECNTFTASRSLVR